MFVVDSRPVIYFSFDSIDGITLHGAVGVVNDEDVSKAFIVLYPLWE